MNYIEKAMQDIKDEAARSGDSVEHVWSIDLQDGTSNVKAIIKQAGAEAFVTVGCRVPNA